MTKGEIKADSGQSHVLKLRVQNICCGKEANLIKSTLSEVEGITSITVNVIGRRAFITHKESIISANDIIERLNTLHLGISLVESGTNIEAKYGKKEILLYLKYISVAVMGCLFIVVAIGHVQHYSFVKWIAIPVLVIGGLPMLWKTIVDFKRCVPININLLMLVAVGGALGLSEWLDACIIVFVFAIAELIENKVRYKIEKDIEDLMMITPEKAVLAETNKAVPVEEVATGSLILVTAGERIPLDGDVVKGKAAVDESSITGEATPISKGIGSCVYSGTIIQSGFLKIKTTCDYQSSTVFRVSQLVAEAQSKASRTEEIVKKFAQFYTPCIVVIALLVFLIPFGIYKTTSNLSKSEFHQWGIRSLTVLLVACPCSIIMAAPITSVCTITKAAQMGVLVKGDMYMEKLAKLDVVVFDKTGTLTEGRFQVLKEHAVEAEYRNETVKLSASLETKSSHPLAASIVNHYSGCITDKIGEFGVDVGLPEVTGFKNHEGMGLSGSAEGHVICVGNLDLMETFNIEVVDEIHQMVNEWSLKGCTVIFAGIDNKLQMLLGLADKCRITAKPVVQMLQASGLECIMLTGDSDGPAHVIKQEVGLTECLSGMKPNEKFEWLQEKQGKGNKKKIVAMVGDGVNDSPSLAAADVGIAIGSSGAAIAVESAGICLMTDDLTKIIDLISLGKYSRKIVWQNIIGGVLIKVAFVIGALLGKNLLWLAILADVLGLLFVMCNGLRPLSWKSGVIFHNNEVITSKNISTSEIPVNIVDADNSEERVNLIERTSNTNEDSLA